jgi:hypothetical protein
MTTARSPIGRPRGDEEPPTRLIFELEGALAMLHAEFDTEQELIQVSV